MIFKKIICVLILSVFLLGIVSCDKSKEFNDNYVDILKLDGTSIEKIKNNSGRRYAAKTDSSDGESDEPHVHEYVQAFCECGAHICTQHETYCVFCGAHMHKYINSYCECGQHDHKYVDGYCDCGEKEPGHILENIIKEGQYVLMFKSDYEFSFTVTLNNPKAEAIDAIEISCDDPNGQIKVDGEYKNIQYMENSKGIKTRIVNWSQEDPYEKTFYIRSKTQMDVSSLKIIDIKVNGEWQRQELKNDELKIYKMDDNDLTWQFVNNTFNGYKWNFKKSDKITDLIVYADDEQIYPDKNGDYCVKKDCNIIWQIEYTNGDIKAKTVKSRFIEVLEIVETYNSYYVSDFEIVEDHHEAVLASLKYTYSSNYERFFFKINKGTDVNLDSIGVILYKNGKAIYGIDNEHGDDVFIECSSMQHAAPGYYIFGEFSFDFIKIKIGNYIYEFKAKDIKLDTDLYYPGDDTIFIKK